jgi:hypothetical protein
MQGYIRNCNIHNTGSVGSWGIGCTRYGTGAGGAVIDAKYNWWRYSDSTIIEDDFVYDYLDDANMPRIEFMPFVNDDDLRPCPSDFDFSGRTDYDDLAMLGFSFGAEPGDVNWLSICNISEIGVSELRIDGLDLAYFGSQFGIEGGCSPFGKMVIPETVANSFSLIATRSTEDEVPVLRLEPVIPAGHELLGIAFDLVADSSLVINDPIESIGRQFPDPSLTVLSSIKGDRRIHAILSMDNKPIDTGFLNELLCFRFDDPARDSGDLAALENLVFVIDDYRIVYAPRVSFEDSREGTLPERFEVFQNYPNPFNPSTTISYALNISSKVEVTIFNTLGQTVRTFVYPQQTPGIHEVVWDGRDSQGNDAATGVYFYRIDSEGNSDTKKMLLLK